MGMKADTRRILTSLILEIIITTAYMLAMYFWRKSVAQAVYFTDRQPVPLFLNSLFGITGYIAALSFVGFFVNVKSSFKSSILCTIGIPCLLVLSVFVFCIITNFQVPDFNQHGEFHEFEPFFIFLFTYAPIGILTITGLGSLSCFIKDSRNRTRRSI
jgi:glucan phosphoethanolaminetransferase (alkaline phosphatase superfamily)